MSAKLTVDKAGRVVLPKPIREQLRLQPGESLELETLEDRLVLRPVRGNIPLRKKQGVWVLRVGEPLTDAEVNEAIQEVREERDRHVLGKKKR